MKTVDYTHRKGTGLVEPMRAAGQGWVTRIGRFARGLLIAVARHGEVRVLGFSSRPGIAGLGCLFSALLL